MKQGQETTQDERAAIIKDCLENGCNYGETAIKHNISYGRQFTSREELVGMIEDYIIYYNSRRLQRNLGVFTPMEKRAQFLAA